MKKSVTLSIVMLSVSLVGYGQEKKLTNREFSFGIGANSSYIKDEFHAPFTYKGINPSLSMNYRSERGNHEFNVQSVYTVGKNQSAVSLPARHAIFQFQANYLVRLNRPQPRLGVAAGVGATGLLATANYNPEISNATRYATAGLALSASGKITYRINEKTSLAAYVSLPLAGIAYRPTYPIDGKSLTGLTHAGKNPWFDSRLEFTRKINSKISFFVAVQFNYFAYQEPRNVAIMQRSLLAGLKINLGR
jgi:hypothetical protein